MACRHCGSANPEGAHFCQACGQSLAPEPRSCPACGAVNLDAAKFCTSCGAALDLQVAPSGSAKPAEAPAHARTPTKPHAASPAPPVAAPALTAPGRQSKVVAFGLWFVALVLFLLGLEANGVGKAGIPFAAILGIAGYLYWPKK